MVRTGSSPGCPANWTARLFSAPLLRDPLVWKLDRLGRSLRHLVETLADLRDRGIGFRSLQESIDTTTSGGKLVFHVFAALAEFERDLIRERTRAGLDAARARGKRGGRRRKLDEKKRAQALTLHTDKSNTIDDI
jgi:DNA invertase Pin-like site-specific DNA recombinase